MDSKGKGKHKGKRDSKCSPDTDKGGTGGTQQAPAGSMGMESEPEREQVVITKFQVDTIGTPYGTSIAQLVHFRAASGEPADTDGAVAVTLPASLLNAQYVYRFVSFGCGITSGGSADVDIADANGFIAVNPVLQVSGKPLGEEFNGAVVAPVSWPLNHPLVVSGRDADDLNPEQEGFYKSFVFACADIAYSPLTMPILPRWSGYNDDGGSISDHPLVVYVSVPRMSGGDQLIMNMSLVLAAYSLQDAPAEGMYTRLPVS